MKPPSAPPPLKAMAARKDKLETNRAQRFSVWKAALEESNGNVTVAGAGFDPPLKKTWSNKVVGKLGLAEYARQLRIKNTGQSLGTPKRK